MGTLSRYWHTIRYLKPVQLYGRIRFRLLKPRVRHIKNVALAEQKMRPFFGCSRPQSFFEDNVFRLHGDSLPISAQEDWNHPHRNKLFLYNLHYFDDLNATNAGSRLQQHLEIVERWITENPPAFGNGWEPYPISLRLVNWIKFVQRQDQVPTYWHTSIATQADYLSRRLEHHLQGNHLFVNAKALVFAGSYLSGEFADHLLQKGLEIINQQLAEQVLDDGAHFELSPMYHSLFVEDMLDLINLSNVYPEKFSDQIITDWKKTTSKMLFWLKNMLHPDGNISFFNDAAFGIAPGYSELVSYAELLDIEVSQLSPDIWHANSSGYVTSRSENIYVAIDIGHVGPDYIPGHAHADTLSFELSVGGQRVFVNSGTSQYGTGAERSRQRGSAAHNTVTLNGADSSEVWGGFRVARRAYPQNVKVENPESSTLLSVSAEHNGFSRLTGSPVHSRRWLADQQKIVITDTIKGPFQTATAWLHLHPAVNVDRIKSGFCLVLPNDRYLQLRIDNADVQILDSTWHPEFGGSEPSKKLALNFKSATITTSLLWSENC